MGRSLDSLARHSNRLRDAVFAFTDRLVPIGVPLAEAEKQADDELRKLPRVEQDRYRTLVNRWVQAYNAWARRAGGTPHESVDARWLEGLVRPVRPVLPLPYSGPILSGRRELVYDRERWGLGPNEVIITFSDGRRRIGVYDTEVFVP